MSDDDLPMSDPMSGYAHIKTVPRGDGKFVHFFAGPGTDRKDRDPGPHVLGRNADGLDVSFEAWVLMPSLLETIEYETLTKWGRALAALTPRQDRPKHWPPEGDEPIDFRGDRSGA